MNMMMNMAMGAQEEEDKVAELPPEPTDPRVKEICRHFGIDDKICEKLNKARVGGSRLSLVRFRALFAGHEDQRRL